MPIPQHVYLARRDAYERIFDESRDSPGRETGGILVGRMFHLAGGRILVVVAASGPGAAAHRRGHTYAPDTLARQNELEAWRETYRPYRVDYVGEWHKHPPGYRQPSAGDTLQVIDILRDSSYSLPDGIFTPIVTIEDGRFMLHGHYYSREQMRAETVECTVADDDIRWLLDQLVALEQQSPDAASRGDSAMGTTRWGVAPEAFDAARAAISPGVPDAEVITPGQFDPATVIIDMYGYIQPARGILEGGGRAASATAGEQAPPFPAAPAPDEIPPAPPLPGRNERELRDLEQFCATQKARVHTQRRDDGSYFYEISFSHPPALDVERLLPPRHYQTPEGGVAIEAPASEQPITLAQIILDPGAEFPDQPPLVALTLSDGRRLHVGVERLFPTGWRSHIRMRDVLKSLLDALQQPAPYQDVSELVEYHGRLVIRQAEMLFRSVADICAELNRSYSFERPGPRGRLDEQAER
jgi:hypothetical protein